MIKKVHTVLNNQWYERGYCSVIDMYMDIGWLDKKRYEDWRFCRNVPYPERVCNTSLNKLSPAMREYRRYCLARGFTPSVTVYKAYGKGHAKVHLRFSKSGDPNIETAYQTHYVDGNRIKELNQQTKLKKENTEMHE